MATTNPSGTLQNPMSINYGGTYNNELKYRYVTGYIDDFVIVDEAVYGDSDFTPSEDYFGKRDYYKLFNNNDNMYGIPNQ